MNSSTLFHCAPVGRVAPRFKPPMCAASSMLNDALSDKGKVDRKWCPPG
jgi:hypothetical protein